MVMILEKGDRDSKMAEYNVVSTAAAAAPSGEALPEVENLFGKYELGKLLGVGAFAKVYHARATRTGQSVAIKAVNKQKLVKGGLKGQVKNEVSIMRRLHHPHIIKLFEVLATKTKIFYVMEFAKGGELFTKIAKGRFSEDLSRKYFQQLISAVGYCHSRGVFHRDLKPENLLLDENWNLKVTDFGLGAIADPVRPDNMLHTLCGTPAYVAPEILAQKGYEGAKIDIWSCGIILYVLNAGYLPFNDRNLMTMYRKIYKGEFRVPKWTSPALRHLLARLLDVNPETRITVDEITRDPWFKPGYKEVKFHLEDLSFKEPRNEVNSKSLNAFDIIALSPGFDLSGLFNTFTEVADFRERLVSAEKPDKIIATVEEIIKKENVTVTKSNDYSLRLKGNDGNCLIVMEIHRLTEKLVVVEINRRERKVESNREKWEDKVRQKLCSLSYKPVEQVIR